MNAILHPLYYAVTWVMVTFHTMLGWVLGRDSHESLKWTLSIVLLVVLIRVILIPLFVKQIKSQRAMTALQPHMKEIQKKHKDDRQKQSEEMMKLYKEHKTNPLAPCLPLLAQAPIFFALFRVLSGIASNKSYVPNVLTAKLLTTAHDAKFFSAPIADSFLSHNATTGTKIVTVCLIAFMSATTFITQRQLMVKGMPKLDPSNNMMAQQQKIMLYVFPFIFAISGVNFPIGVLIYWSTTNLWTFGQQYYVIKRNPTPGSPAYEELQRKRGLTETPQTPEGMTEAQREAEAAKSRQRQQPKKKKPRK
ncbi:MAG: membrane protein insertase YidC [Actinomycetes bacterium]|jgi:YidC/Oxa1 family membrane protein insertase